MKIQENTYQLARENMFSFSLSDTHLLPYNTKPHYQVSLFFGSNLILILVLIHFILIYFFLFSLMSPLLLLMPK
jgi:hypothetical protein